MICVKCLTDKDDFKTPRCRVCDTCKRASEVAKHKRLYHSNPKYKERALKEWKKYRQSENGKITRRAIQKRWDTEHPETKIRFHKNHPNYNFEYKAKRHYGEFAQAAIALRQLQKELQKS